ncbi:TRAP transporter permease [Chloroflexota bacterium]
MADIGTTQAKDLPQKAAAVNTRDLTGTPGRILWWFSVLFAIYVVLTLGGVFEMMGIFIEYLRYDALILMYVFILTYIHNPMTKGSPKDRVPWYDIIAIFLGIIVTGYIFIVAEELPRRIMADINTMEITFGMITVVLILEGVRRTIGPVLTVLGILFFIYPYISQYLPGFLEGTPPTLDAVMRLLYLYPYGIFGRLLHIFSTIVAPFLIFGSFLMRSGAGEFFITLATSMMGQFRGGPAKIAVLASSFFGSISGSPLANVTTTGAITIPMMKKLGYEPHFAGAVEAVASTGGQIMPPVLGAAAFMMINFLGLPYITIITAAIIPALLYYLALFTMLDLEAAKKGLKGLPKEDLPSLRATIKNGWPYVIPLVILLVLIGPLHFSPQTSCIWSIVAVISCSWLMKGRGMRPRKVADSLSGGMKVLPNVLIIMEVAAILVGVFELTGLGLRITGGLVALAGGSKLVILLMAAFGAMLMGMGMPTSGVYLMTAILVAPALIHVGIPPLVAHFYCWYYGLAAALTPPVCITSFVAAAMAQAPYMKTGVQGVRLGIVIFLVPIMFAYAPELLLIGTLGNVAIAVITAVIGVLLLSSGIEGYLFRPTNWLIRITLLAGGLAMMIPVLTSDIIGIVLGSAAVLWQFAGRRSTIKGLSILS